jgi:hypothetical protein
MMKNKILLFVFLFLPLLVRAQPIPDATVVIHQNTLNGFLNAVGPVGGKAPYDIMGMKGEYTWQLEHARIELKPNQAQFIADAHIKVGIFSTGSVARGDVEVKYHPETNRISVKVLRATFEVYINFFGKKIHITDIDASRFYRPEFEFAGPQPIQACVDVDLPDSQKKTIYITPYGQLMHIEQERIVVTSQLKFTDQPPAAPQPDHH